MLLGNRLLALMRGQSRDMVDPDKGKINSESKVRLIEAGAAMVLVWGHWFYIQFGQALSLFEAWRSGRRGLTASSMVAFGIRTSGVSKQSLPQ
jgi:hypothetical protein